jgi:hypothetical protein
VNREGTWWVQVYVADGTDHGYALDDKQDVEVQGPLEGLRHIAETYGEDFLLSQWSLITSEGDTIAWLTDYQGVVLMPQREYPGELEEKADKDV